MGDELAKLFKEMRTNHEAHRDRLKAWRDKGGSLEKWPEGENIDDMIVREQQAIDNLTRNIERLNAS